MGAVYAACDRWGEQWKDTTMMLVTDSVVVQAALPMGRSRSEVIMYYMRRLFWLAVGNNFEFKSVYIRSKDNIICDALSHLDDRSSHPRILDVDTGGFLWCRDKLSGSLFAYMGSNCEGNK